MKRNSSKSGPTRDVWWRICQLLVRVNEKCGGQALKLLCVPTSAKVTSNPTPS